MFGPVKRGMIGNIEAEIFLFLPWSCTDTRNGLVAEMAHKGLAGMQKGYWSQQMDYHSLDVIVHSFLRRQR